MGCLVHFLNSVGIQVSGSLYGALAGSIIAYPIADLLGNFFLDAYLIFYPSVNLVVRYLLLGILWRRKKKRTDHSSCTVFGWWLDHWICT